MKIPGGYTIGSDPAREISARRVINAPRDLVFSAFSDREHIGVWWGPTGFKSTTSKMEFKSGGTWEFVMHGPDGRDWDNRVVYDEIVPPKLIISHHAAEGGPVLFYNVITLEDRGSKTLVTLHGIMPTAEERERVAREVGAVEGAQQNLDRLASFIERKQTTSR